MSIEQVRLEAMFKATDRGAKRSDELLRAADDAQREITDKRGRNSVANFLRISHKIHEIDHIRKSTPREDREWHTDMWVVLKKSTAGRKMFPLEIKSSDYGVREVKEGKDFKRNQVYLVVNANKRRADLQIINDFWEEIERVCAILGK
ncbi:MAG: hypothetical protein UX13_C0022G0014 [Candidatus Woesebacteria bacterium GW2011_GWB1_45_5]|uniref:Uncharacterized protein n=1 Tax=Candidatus Woesebacteria bacterium GW2011_GWB1_45_5 TaxID=1618581 RepID=A0A0G1PX61_9BACT|nr:MAG: hypothetical protein UX13_C0022G0014 [Candidatus Woesebacteria bacterium GW2011_GWB1_45_5]